MCITFFFINREPHAKIKFALVHNREEDFARETSVLGEFEDDKNIFGGRDLKEGGTWLGINALTKNIAFVTNRFAWPMMKDRFLAKFSRNAANTAQLSRGNIVREFISSSSQYAAEEMAGSYASIIFQNRQQLKPFHLLLGNLREMEFVFQSPYDNFPPVSLRDGFYTFCNHSSFEQPLTKQTVGLARFKQIIKDSISQAEEAETLSQQQLPNTKVLESTLIQNIHELMQNSQKHLSLHFLLIPQESSIFVPPYYNYFSRQYRGTRTSTVLLLNDANELTLSETTYSRVQQEPTNKTINIQL